MKRRRLLAAAAVLTAASLPLSALRSTLPR